MSSYSLVWESFYLEENSGNQPFSYFCTYSDHFLKLSLLRNLDDLKQLYVCVRVWMCTRTCPHMLSSSVVSDSLQPHGLQPARLLCPQNFLGKNTGVDCHSLLQGIFLTQGLNLGLLHCRQFLCHLRHRGRSGRGLL